MCLCCRLIFLWMLWRLILISHRCSHSHAIGVRNCVNILYLKLFDVLLVSIVLTIVFNILIFRELEMTIIIWVCLVWNNWVKKLELHTRSLFSKIADVFASMSWVFASFRLFSITRLNVVTSLTVLEIHSQDWIISLKAIEIFFIFLTDMTCHLLAILLDISWADIYLSVAQASFDEALAFQMTPWRLELTLRKIDTLTVIMSWAVPFPIPLHLLNFQLKSFLFRLQRFLCISLAFHNILFSVKLLLKTCSW